MQQHITIKGGVEVDNALVGKAKVDGALGFYALTLAAVVAIVFIYMKYGHKHASKIFKRKQK
jgi:hypothetical protein